MPKTDCGKDHPITHLLTDIHVYPHKYAVPEPAAAWHQFLPLKMIFRICAM